jgi:isopropylmalate/homocitrate/citramalate synthase
MPTSKHCWMLQTDVVTIFGKTWGLHVTDVLNTTLDDNLRIIEGSVAYLVAQGKRVIYDGEHTFDGYKADHVLRAGNVSSSGARGRGDGRVVRYQRRGACPGK